MPAAALGLALFLGIRGRLLLRLPGSRLLLGMARHDGSERGDENPGGGDAEDLAILLS